MERNHGPKSLAGKSQLGKTCKEKTPENSTTGSLVGVWGLGVCWCFRMLFLKNTWRGAVAKNLSWVMNLTKFKLFDEALLVQVLFAKDV